MERRIDCASSLPGSTRSIALVRSRQSFVRFCSNASLARSVHSDKFPTCDSPASRRPTVAVVSFCDIVRHSQSLNGQTVASIVSKSGPLDDARRSPPANEGACEFLVVTRWDHFCPALRHHVDVPQTKET